MGLEIRPLTKHIGAELRGIDLRQPLDEATRAAIYKAWLDHLVIVFPDQKLEQEDLLRVSSYFGEIGALRRPPKFFPPGFNRLLPNIMLISNIRENGEPIGALPDGEMMFHHDMIHAPIPHNGTFLYSVEIPTHGGNTLFASGYAAYDTLDAKLRDKLEGKIALHHYNYGSTKKGDGHGTEAFGQSKHPLFRTHEETKRKAKDKGYVETIFGRKAHYPQIKSSNPSERAFMERFGRVSETATLRSMATDTRDPEKRTLEIYVDEINAKGGINGQKLQLIIYDDGGDANNARTFATRLVEEDKVVAMVGGVHNACAAEQAKRAHFGENRRVALFFCISSEHARQ